MKQEDYEKTWLSDWKMPLILFLGALAIRLVYLFQIQDIALAKGLVLDSASYDRLARMIADGNWLGEEIFFQAPLYPYLLAVIYKIFGHSLNLVRTIQLILGALNCAVIFWTAKSLFGRKTGIWCGTLAAFYGIFVFYEATIGKDGISIFLTDLALFGLVLSLKNPSWHRWLLSGIVLGCAILTRGNLVLLLPLLVVWMAIVLRSYPLRIVAGAIASFSLGAVIIVSLVTLRNYVVGNDFVLTTSQGGQNFYIGNNPRASGFFENPKRIRLNPKYEEADFKAEALRKTGRKEMKPSEISGFWFNEGLRFIGQNPKRALSLLFTKTAMFWNYFEIPDNYNYYFFRQEVPILSLLFVGFGLVAPLGIFGLYLARKNPAAWLFMIFILGYMASIVPFHMASRYRLPIVPVLIIFAGYTITRTVEALRSKALKPAALGLVAVAILALLVNWRVIDEADTFKAPYTELGIIATERGDYKKALDNFNKALEIDPSYAAAHYNMGNAMAAQGAFKEAIKAYKKAIEADGEMLMAYDNLGKSYLQIGHFDKALRTFDILADLRPDLEGGLIGKGLVYHTMGNYDKAIAAFKEALDIRLESASAYYNLACAYAGSGFLKKARAALAKAVELNPGYEKKAERDSDLEIVR